MCNVRRLAAGLIFAALFSCSTAPPPSPDLVNTELAGLGNRIMVQEREIMDLKQQLVSAQSLVERERKLMAQIVDLEKRAVDLTDLAGSEARLLEARIATLNSLFSKEIAAGDLMLRRFRNVLVIEVKETVLFVPDMAELLPGNVGLLFKLAEVFKKSPERIVRVEGSTAVAISSAVSLKLYPTSWHLGAARAANVVQYLQEVGQVDPNQLVAASLGEYSPVADNATEQGKAQNRRVEFVMSPRELWQIERLAGVTK